MRNSTQVFAFVAVVVATALVIFLPAPSSASISYVGQWADPNTQNLSCVQKWVEANNTNLYLMCETLLILFNISDEGTVTFVENYTGSLLTYCYDIGVSSRLLVVYRGPPRYTGEPDGLISVFNRLPDGRLDYANGWTYDPWFDLYPSSVSYLYESCYGDNFYMLREFVGDCYINRFIPDITLYDATTISCMIPYMFGSISQDGQYYYLHTADTVDVGQLMGYNVSVGCLLSETFRTDFQINTKWPKGFCITRDSRHVYIASQQWRINRAAIPTAVAGVSQALNAYISNIKQMGCANNNNAVAIMDNTGPKVVQFSRDPETGTLSFDASVTYNVNGPAFNGQPYLITYTTDSRYILVLSTTNLNFKGGNIVTISNSL